MANIGDYFERRGTKKSAEELMRDIVDNTIGTNARNTLNQISSSAINLGNSLQNITNSQKILLGGKSFTSPLSGNTGKDGKSSRSIGFKADNEQLPDDYLIKITSSALEYTVVSPMQDKISLRVTSNWEPFLPLGGIRSIINQISQATAKKALVTKFASRRIWKGTTPVEISLTLVFNAINDPYSEVILPVQVLLQMAAPGEGEKVLGAVPLLTPPGPSPFKISDGLENSVNAKDKRPLNEEVDKAAQKAIQHLSNGDNISIDIGTFMQFKSVIVKDVTPVMDAKLHKSGLPISAEVNIIFETYEILTKESIASDVFKTTGA